MKPPPFSYHDPQTVSEAVRLLGSLDNAKLLAGGHVHSLAAKGLLGVVLLCGFGVSVAASVVRQVFAVSLLRMATASGI